MTIQPLLLDIIKQMGIGKIDKIAVSTNPSGTLTLRTYDPDRDLIITANTVATQDFSGEFGLFNFKVLKGLLNMSNFQTETSVVEVKTRKLPDGTEMPDRIEFKGGGSKATFRLMSREVVPEQPEIGNIPWDTDLNLSSSKIAEFGQMAGLYMDVDADFTLRSETGNIVADFGSTSAATHSGTMVLLEDSPYQINGDIKFKIDKFLLMLKIASGAKTMGVRLCSRGLLGVSAVTEHGEYEYMLKKSM